MTLILLIRHGENDVMRHRLSGYLPGISLNALGKQQALALSEALKQAPIKAIYSSPMERAVETAEPLAKSHGLEIQLRPALLDVNYGEWQGRSFKQLQRMNLWKKMLESPSQIRFPGGETFAEVQQRVINVLDGLVNEWQLPPEVKNQPDQVIAVVAHADVVRLVLAHILGMPLDNFFRLHISPASISIIQQKANNRPNVLCINQRAFYSWPEHPNESNGKKSGINKLG